MKKFLIVVFMLVVMVGQANNIYSQNVVDGPGNSPPGNRGQATYYTHPEFTNIMTTTVTTPAQNTDDGYVFVGAVHQFYGGPSAAIILDNSGEPIYIKPVNDNFFIGDFRKQTVNGTDYLTYHVGSNTGGWTYGSSYVLNENYQTVDSWTLDGGLGSDIHEFILLDNGHAILLGYVPTPFDLSPYGGPVNGILVDVVIQEQDANKNVVFEWIASEHMPIGDTEVNINTTNPVDFLHTNAIAVDDDGNWLLSHRNFSEITKINRQTGDIMWRMGGAGNEFTFTNDIGFSNQHNINRLDNGHLLLFDNGNGHTPPHSRMVEYIVDEVTKTVTLYKMYPTGNDGFSVAMGNTQRLPSGNTMIGWGTQAKLTEIQSDGSVALEMLLGSISYRSFRFPWTGVPSEAPRATVRYTSNPTAVTVYTSWNGATDITSYNVYAGATSSTMTLVGNAPRSGFETEIPLTGLPSDTCFFQTKPIDGLGDPTPFSNVTFRQDLQVCRDQLYHPYLPLFFK
ncbi:MAG: arylsulfotransferase family protein [Candidatus Promineifilaceae bacterium]